jgi:photosystem I subunit IX
MMAKDNQANYFSRYLSSAPLLAILAVSAAYTLFILINWVRPDLIFLGK